MFPLSEFYRHKDMTDGYLSYCKSCTKKRIDKHRAKNIEKIKAYDRVRSALPHRASARRDYSKTEKGKEVKARTSKKWIENNPKKRRAHQAIKNEIRSNRLKKEPCSICGKPNVHAHHFDYDKPLDIIWLCPKCHSDWHKSNKVKNEF